MILGFTLSTSPTQPCQLGRLLLPLIFFLPLSVHPFIQASTRLAHLGLARTIYLYQYGIYGICGIYYGLYGIYYGIYICMYTVYVFLGRVVRVIYSPVS